MLEARGIHPGRSARQHLRCLAQADALPMSRVDEVLEIVGLTNVANKRAGGFSLGMNQRLGLAAALLGDPGILLLDEPVNGLDPEGIIWIRTLLRGLAAEGRTILLSSHLMSEMAMTADHLIVIGRGRLIADTGIDEVIRRSSGNRVRVRSPHAERLATRLREAGATVEPADDAALEVSGWTCAQVGDLAAASGAVIHELVAEVATLEEAYLELTQDSVEYRPDPTTTSQTLSTTTAA